MCRIAGIVSPLKQVTELQHTVAAMCHQMRHGGPDDHGLYTDEAHHLVFGHRRLAIIDVSKAGHQPMHYANGRYTITFNGEIYNYPELKKELVSIGYQFQSSTDTEVILAAFAAWGTASFSRLDGMFSFALFDALTANVFLVRDVMGIKPLYYSWQKDTLTFASEVRAFHQTEEKENEHPHWPVYLMAYGHLPEPVTTLKNVLPLPKGTFLQFNTRTRKIRSELFDHISFFEKEENRADAISHVSLYLKAAVKRHLLSDAPIGVFLSGGIDSSILALLAKEVSGNELKSLSLHFKEKEYSEKQYQDLLVQHLCSTHHQYQLTKEEFHFNLPEIMAAMDLPSSDGLNTWFISRFAAENGIKAVLSGLGGDELFGGYPSFKRIRLSSILQGTSPSALKSGRYTKTKKFRRLAYLSLKGLKGQYLFLRGHFVPSSIARFLNLDEAQVWNILEKEPVLPQLSYLTPENKASWMELNLYMQNQLLRDADVMSMAHGVEIRTPFLDKEFVKLAARISTKVKYSGAVGKQLLIDSFQSTLPEEVWKRKKMGFTFPFAEWLKEDEWVKSKMMSGDTASRKIMQSFEKGDLHWSGLMTTLLLRTNNYAKPHSFLNA